MRGQISLDLILAITVGFFAIGAVFAVNAQIGEMQTDASILDLTTGSSANE